MGSTLDTLAPELMAQVASHLSISSLCSTRLVSKSLNKGFNREFLQRLKTQTVHLTKQGLERLRSLASTPCVGPAVRKLNLICLYYHEKPCRDDFHATERTSPTSPYLLRRDILRGFDISPHRRRGDHWMTERQAEQLAFSGESMHNLLSESLRKFGSLDEITLEAAVVLGVGDLQDPERVDHLAWRHLWTRTIQAYHVLMSAITVSKIKLSSLVIYKNTLKCSIPVNEFAAPLVRLHDDDFLTFWIRLQNFSISLATPVIPIRPTSHMDSTWGFEPFDLSSGWKLRCTDPQVVENTDIKVVTQLFRSMLGLTSLEIHMYRTVCTFADDELPYQPFIDEIIRSPSTFPHLVSLTLRGLQATPATIRNILSQHPRLRSLSLRNIYLTRGSWDQALATVTHATSLKHLHLSNLWRPGGQSVINLDPVTAKLDPSDRELKFSRYPCETGSYVWHTRDIAEEELRRGLDFDPTSVGDRRGSKSSHFWACTQRTECGPP